MDGRGGPPLAFALFDPVPLSEVFFSKSNLFIFEYFDPQNMFLRVKVNNCRGDLCGITAKATTLVPIVNRKRNRCYRVARSSDLTISDLIFRQT